MFLFKYYKLQQLVGSEFTKLLFENCKLLVAITSGFSITANKVTLTYKTYFKTW